MKISIYFYVSLIYFISLLFSSEFFAQTYTDTLFTEGIAENSLGEIFVGIEYFDPQLAGFVIKSTDSGQSWFRVDSGLSYADPFELKIADNDFVFLTGTSTGVFRSTSNGSSWEKCNLFNYLNTDNYAITISHNNVFVGVRDDPTLFLARSSNYGENWTDLSSNFSSEVWSLTSFNNFIYAGTLNDGVMISTDYGDSWFQSSLLSEQITYLAADANGIVWAGTFAGSLFKTTDNGNNWVEISAGWNPHCIASILPLDNNVIILAFGRWVALPPGDTLIFKTTDGGSSWTPADCGIEFGAINNIIISSNNILFATTWDGLYKSTDLGENWIQIESLITGMQNQKTNFFIQQYMLNQNYPNPFNPVTRIKYQLPKEGFVTIEIFNILGQKVETLLNKFQKADRYEIEFNGVGLASGVYIYTMRVNDFNSSKKMILLR